MDIKAGKPYPAGALSNFAPHPFTFRNIKISSMEGFLQSLKFKEPDIQKHVCTMVGLKAKQHGKPKKWYRTQTLWWQGEEIDRHSKQYQELLDEAFEQMFRQNEKAKKALLATGNAILKHSIGRRKENETVLTQTEFCSRLMKIREMLRAEDAMEF